MEITREQLVKQLAKSGAEIGGLKQKLRLRKDDLSNHNQRVAKIQSRIVDLKDELKLTRDALGKASKDVTALKRAFAVVTLKGDEYQDFLQANAT